MNCVKDKKSPTLTRYEQKEEHFNLEEIKKEALEQFRSGKSLYGKDGAFAPMFKSFLESALEGELNSQVKQLRPLMDLLN